MRKFAAISLAGIMAFGVLPVMADKHRGSYRGWQ